MTDQDARGWYVYNTLTQHAARTQVGLQEFLKSRRSDLPIVLGGEHDRRRRRSLLVEQLAARTDVARVDSNLPARWIENPEVAKFGVNDSEPNAPNCGGTGRDKRKRSGGLGPWVSPDRESWLATKIPACAGTTMR